MSTTPPATPPTTEPRTVPPTAPTALLDARTLGVALALVVLLLASVVASLALGSRSIPLSDVVRALLGHGDAGVIGIVGDLRVNRTVVGLACGAALGMAGVLVQGLTRNPVAEPGLLGVNAGAAFAVTVVITVFGTLPLGVTVWAAVAGAALATTVVLVLAGRSPAGGAQVLLCGVALAAVLSGLTHALVLSDESVGERYRSWQVGSLTARTMDDLTSVAPLLAVGAVVACALMPALNALALGDDLAHGLGVRPARARVAGLLAVALLAGAATALAGPISFVGMVVPHALRALVGADHRRLLPLAALGGPSLLLLADVAGRLLGDGSELQVGVVTALVGAPVLALVVLAPGRKGAR